MIAVLFQTVPYIPAVPVQIRVELIHQADLMGLGRGIMVPFVGRIPVIQAQVVGDPYGAAHPVPAVTAKVRSLPVLFPFESVAHRDVGIDFCSARSNLGQGRSTGHGQRQQAQHCSGHHHFFHGKSLLQWIQTFIILSLYTFSSIFAKFHRRTPPSFTAAAATARAARVGSSQLIPRENRGSWW